MLEVLLGEFEWELFLEDPELDGCVMGIRDKSDALRGENSGVSEGGRRLNDELVPAAPPSGCNSFSEDCAPLELELPYPAAGTVCGLTSPSPL